jgi:hypothetical protein
MVNAFHTELNAGLRNVKANQADTSYRLLQQ